MQDQASTGLLSDLFDCLSERLTIVNLMTVFGGNPQPLQSLWAPLQHFVNTYVLRGEPPTVENIDRAVTRIIDEMRDDIHATYADVKAREDIDFGRTLTRFLREQLTITIRMIVNLPDDHQNFGRDLFERLRRVIHEFIVLSQFCVEDSKEAVERIILTRLACIAKDAPPMIQPWLAGLTLQQLRLLLPTITIGPDDIQHYVVRRADP